MTRFKFNITREYTITEGVERWFEADDATQAQAMADAEAAEYNQDYPDDCSEFESGGTEIANFSAELVTEP